MADLWAPLQERQFDMNGFVFGSLADDVIVLTDGFDPGSATMRDQDVQPTGSDRTLMGRDYLSTRTILLTVVILREGRDDSDVWDLLDEVAGAWRADDVRDDPGRVVYLRWRANGRTRMVWGRPRQFERRGQVVWDDTFVTAQMGFTLSDQTVYDGESPDGFTLTLRLGSPAQSFWVLPLELPWVPSLASSHSPNTLRNGNVRVPFQATFTADPAFATDGLVLSWPGGKLALRQPLLPGHTVSVDTRTRVQLVDGKPGKAFTLDSSVDGTLPPGETVLSFYAGGMPTNATCVVTWRPGSAGI